MCFWFLSNFLPTFPKRAEFVSRIDGVLGDNDVLMSFSQIAAKINPGTTGGENRPKRPLEDCTGKFV